MFEIDRAKFGAFVSELRKEKELHKRNEVYKDMPQIQKEAIKWFEENWNK